VEGVGTAVKRLPEGMSVNKFPAIVVRILDERNEVIGDAVVWRD
jgi:hypothetical protein